MISSGARGSGSSSLEDKNEGHLNVISLQSSVLRQLQHSLTGPIVMSFGKPRVAPVEIKASAAATVPVEGSAAIRERVPPPSSSSPAPWPSPASSPSAAAAATATPVVPAPESAITRLESVLPGVLRRGWLSSTAIVPLFRLIFYKD